MVGAGSILFSVLFLFLGLAKLLCSSLLFVDVRGFLVSHTGVVYFNFGFPIDRELFSMRCYVPLRATLVLQ